MTPLKLFSAPPSSDEIIKIIDSLVKEGTLNISCKMLQVPKQ